MNISNQSSNLLKSHTLFSALKPDEFEDLLKHSKEIQVDTGQTLFSQGEDASHFYFVVSGKFKLSRVAPSGNEKVIEIIGAEETIAEALMFMDQKQFPVTAEALEKSQVISIRCQPYFQLLQERADLCFRIMGSLCIRLHQRLQEIERLSLQNATDRLIHYLATHIPEDAEDGYELVLDIPKRVLASRLSMLPETFSRVLHKLANENLIEVHSRKITITDANRLKDYYRFEN